MCFICACMYVTTQLELCLHEQTQKAANAACRERCLDIRKQMFIKFVIIYVIELLIKKMWDMLNMILCNTNNTFVMVISIYSVKCYINWCGMYIAKVYFYTVH